MTAPTQGELVASQREVARRLGISHTALQKAVQSGRIAPEPDGRWDIDKTRRRLVETADPNRSPLAGSASADATPFARLRVRFETHEARAILRTSSMIEAAERKARADSIVASKWPLADLRSPLASLRLRLIRAKKRSTTQRRGSAAKPI